MNLLAAFVAVTEMLLAHANFYFVIGFNLNGFFLLFVVSHHSTDRLSASKQTSPSTASSSTHDGGGGGGGGGGNGTDGIGNVTSEKQVIDSMRCHNYCHFF